MTEKFNIGDKVRITTEIMLNNGPTNKAEGVVEKIDGEYYYVRPKYYKHFVECYACELEPR